MASREKLEDLNITHEELEKLTEALKQDEFKKLFFEYVEEISSSENRERYESEIRQLENERGMDVKFINPEPGYVIKTTVGGETKAFINVCKNENVGKPSSVKKVGKDGRPGLSWTLPHSFTTPREDLDREKKKCQIFDFVVHPDTYRMAETNTRFRKMINDLALNGIRKQFDVDPDTKNVKFPKMKYKGTPTPTVIRTRLPDSSPAVNKDPSDIMSQFPYPYDNQTSAEKAKQREEEYARKHSTKKKASEKKKETKRCEENKKESETDSDFAVPKYAITHRSELDYQDYAVDPDIRRKSTRPKALIVEVFLPLLSSAVPIQLDIFERQLKLVSTKPAKYKLEVMLPYAVDENQGSARFDKARRKLVVTLPVVGATTTVEPLQFRSNLFCGGGELSSEEQESEQVTRDDDTDTDFVLNLPNCSADRSLIEEISSSYHDDEQKTNADMSTTSELGCANLENGIRTQETEQVGETNGQSVFTITHILPPFECTQTSQTVHFDFCIFKVSRETISVTAPSANAVQLKMVSVGEGGFPVHYSCYISYDKECNILTNGLHLEVTKDKVVLSLVKDTKSFGRWNRYSVGTGPASLETCEFVDNSKSSDGTAALISTELQDDGLQTDSSVEVQAAECRHDDGINNSITEESKFIADSDRDVDTDCHASSPTDNVLPEAVNGEIRQLSDENSSDLCDDTVACLTELDSATPSDTGGRQVRDRSHADSTTANITVQRDSDIPVTGSTSDSESNESPKEAEAESSNVEQNDDVACDSEASNKICADSSRRLVEEIDASDSAPPADSSTSNELSRNNEPIRPNTMLSWSDSPHDGGTTSKTKCAVQFENSVIFDLDVE